jgi:excisionase family DNA binding protein
MDSPEEFLTPQEIATRLKLTEATIWRWIREGTLPAIKIGPKVYRVTQEEYQKIKGSRPE